MGFFDKLKMSAGQEPAPKAKEEKKKQSSSAKATEDKGKQKLKIKPKVTKPEPKLQEKQEEPKEEMPLKKVKEEKSDFEGELAIDVYETDGYFIVQSTIAGVKAGNLDITIENDIVTVRGSREKQVSEETKKYYYQECYWGAFSRQVILPEEVDGSKAEASIKDGVLTLKIPKIARVQKRKIAIKQED